FLGFSADDALEHRLADNFTVTAAAGWHITGIDVFGYVTDTPVNAPSPFTSSTLQIWRGRPGDTGSTIVFGDPATNRLSASVQVMILRGNSQGNANGRIRTIWANTLAADI